MHFREVFAFDVAHGGLGWPWITFAAGGNAFAAAATTDTIASYTRTSDAVVAGGTFPLPADARIPSKTAPDAPPAPGLVSFTLDVTGRLLAVVSRASKGAFVATLDGSGERRRVDVASLVGEGHEVHAVAFDRRGTRLWLSLESGNETVLALLDVATLAVVGVLRTPAFPRPSLHELHLHPEDDAVLLVAACADVGTFARVVGFAGDTPSWVEGALDTGSVSAGFVGFSARGARVFLVEADEIRTHAWPGMQELASVHLADEFVSSFSGTVLGDHVLVDGEDVDEGTDAVMQFDVSATAGRVLASEAPKGMWAGKLGDSMLVTVEAKGEPSKGRVYRALVSKGATAN